ncbi:uncharacterized protein LOC144108898 isoform X2 [Amblyomma americanum]
MASSWYSPDAQLIPRDAATTHRLRALTSRYVPVVNELVDVDQVRFAFLLFGTMNSRHGAARHPCSRPLVDYLTGVTSDFRVVRSCVDECGESADEIVLEILYVMHKFEPMRRIFGVCKHRAGTLFQSPRRIGKFWRELANFCEACLDEEAVEILRHFLPETSMSTVATHAEAVVVLLYENGIITLDNYSALYEHIREKYNNEELLEHLCETIPQYPMTNSPHGYAVILNHSTFKDSKNVIELEDRHGTEKDVGALKQLWEELDFEVRVYNDYTADEIEDLLKEVATVWDHRRSDAFIFVVLSHGYRDEPARGVGERRSRAHVLKFMSTVSNSLSYRDPHYGSVFVQAFVDAVRRHWRNHDLLQIGTFINSGVADKPIPVVSSDGRNINWSSQTSEVSNTLTRALYLGRR